MRRTPWWPGSCLLALLAWHSPSPSANTIEDLQAAGELQVSSALSPTDTLVPGQKATLTLQIATNRWFAGGTRIGIPEVPGLVILQTEQFASNASENRDGQSWVVQRWTLDVYPQRAGDFTIPAVPLRVNVNAGEAGNTEGELYSPPTEFSVTVPQNLSQAEQWVAAPSFEVSQSFDRALNDLQVGDAFEREIRFEAKDVRAMMLPTFTPEDLPGLAAYASPPLLENRSNRGQASATRSQRISYVVQAQGDYLLPAREYFWWDTQRRELQLLALPASRIIVGVGAAAGDQPDLAMPPRKWLLAAVGLLLGAVLWLASKRLRQRPAAGLITAVSALWHRLQALRKPALPQKLNPDNSAAG